MVFYRQQQKNFIFINDQTLYIIYIKIQIQILYKKINKVFLLYVSMLIIYSIAFLYYKASK